MRFLLSILTTFALLSPVLAAPIYNPDHNGVHRMKPQHIRHIDEHGHVTYIHDQSDHRPDFCSIPGEEELCRLQIEAANRAPPVFDNGQTVQSIEPSELNPEHGQSVHRENIQDVTSNSHANDITITLDNGEQVTLHNDGHPKNIYDPANDPDAPPADTPHTPNINHGLRHAEHIKDDEYQPPSRPHIRNIKPGTEDEIPTINHPDNINHGANGLRQRERMADAPIDDVIPDRPHIRNINDHPDTEGPVTINHPDNTRNQHGQSVAMHTSSDKQTASQPMHIMDVDPDTNTPQDDDVIIDTNPHVGSFGPHPEYPKQRRPINKLKQNIQNLM